MIIKGENSQESDSKINKVDMNELFTIKNYRFVETFKL